MYIYRIYLSMTFLEVFANQFILVTDTKMPSLVFSIGKTIQINIKDGQSNWAPTNWLMSLNNWLWDILSTDELSTKKNDKKKKLYLEEKKYPPSRLDPWTPQFLGLVDPSRNRLASTAYFANYSVNVLCVDIRSACRITKVLNNVFYEATKRVSQWPPV